jgi:ribosomal protein S18 acetylase RimI-like enzyme
MIQQLLVRKANFDDLNALQQFEQGIISAERPFDPTLREDPIYYYDLNKMITESHIDLVVTELDKELLACGYARIETAKPYLKHERHAYLGMMYVHPLYRGRGINKIIIEELKRLVQERGVTELRLEVFSQNEPAIKAYEKVGFTSHIIQMRMSL